MAEKSKVWQDVQALLEQIKKSLLSNLPAKGISVTPADAVALGTYWRCMSLFRSIILLLNNNHPEEALMLWRALFTDSLRMKELEAAGNDRIAIQLGHYAYSLERTKKRFEEAKRMGITDDITNELAHIEEQKRKMESYRKGLGIGQLKKFSSEKNIVEKLNLKVDMWAFIYSHGFVHGEDIAQSFRRRNIQPNVYAFFSHTPDPELLAGVGLAAAESIVHTHEAAANMFGWEVSSELQELLATIQSRLEKS